MFSFAEFPATSHPITIPLPMRLAPVSPLRLPRVYRGVCVPLCARRRRPPLGHIRRLARWPLRTRRWQCAGFQRRPAACLPARPRSIDPAAGGGESSSARGERGVCSDSQLAGRAHSSVRHGRERHAPHPRRKWRAVATNGRPDPPAPLGRSRRARRFAATGGAGRAAGARPSARPPPR